MLSFYVGVYSLFYFKGLEPEGKLRGRRAEERKGKWGRQKEKMTEGWMLRCCC